MWKLIDANIRAARYMLNMVLLFGILYALITSLPVPLKF